MVSGESKKRSYPELPVLVVDDEAAALELCRDALRSHGLDNVLVCQDSREVLPLLGRCDVAVVLLDLRMPYVSGEELLAAIREDHPDVPVVVITGINEVNTAVQCMKAGAFDYLVKPVEESRVATAALRAVQLRELERENRMLRERVLHRELEMPEAFNEIVTDNEDMLSVMQYIEAVARSSSPLLITGETGVGKELFARAAHKASGRNGEFVAVNVAGLDDTLFSDALFGHVRGAYTGAERPLKGLVEQAAGGSLFLDEIGELGAASQVKLLRLLQEREYSPLGSNITKRSDARVVVATNRDIDAALCEGAFRKDLYYRLRTHRILVPPLRERLDDLPLLLDFFIQEAALALDKTPPAYPPQLPQLLAAHSFPGNVRELRGMVQDAMSLHKGRMLSTEIFKQHIEPEDIAPAALLSRSGGLGNTLFSGWTELPSLRQVTEDLIEEALGRASGNQTIAARLLGMSREALNKRLTRGRK